MDKFQKGGKTKSSYKKIRDIKKEAIKKAQGNNKQAKSGYKGDKDDNVSSITKGYASNRKVSEDSEYIDKNIQNQNVKSIKDLFKRITGKTRLTKDTIPENNSMEEFDYDDSAVNEMRRGSEDILGIKPMKKVNVLNVDSGQVEEHFITPDADGIEANSFADLVKKSSMNNEPFMYKGNTYKIQSTDKTPTEMNNMRGMDEYMDSPQRQAIENTMQQMKSTSNPENTPQSNEEFKKGGKMKKGYKIYSQGGKLIENPKIYDWYDKLSAFDKSSTFKLNGKMYSIEV